MRLLIAIVVWIAAIAGAAGLSTVVADSIHTSSSSTAAGGVSGSGSGGFSGSGGSGSSGSGSSGAPFDASSLTATDPRSLFHTSNFARVLAATRAHLGAGTRLDMLVIYPGYASLTAVKGGSEVNIYINAAGTYMQNDTGGNPGSSPLFGLGSVSPNVPAALTRRIATFAHVPASQLHYMVGEVNPADQHFRWLIYPRTGNRVEYFQASGASGQLLQLLNNSSSGLQPVAGT